MIRCETCARLIDSDDDPECFTPDERVMCEPCRDKQWNEAHDAARAEYDAAPLSERNPEQYRQEMREAGHGHLLGDSDA